MILPQFCEKMNEETDRLYKGLSVSSSLLKKSAKGQTFSYIRGKMEQGEKNDGKGKMERGVVELVDTESLVPQEHLLRKVDKAVDFRKL